MRILLVRHGESEGNIDPSVYIEKGDSRIGLTSTGWTQALNAGKFLKDRYTSAGTKQWPVIFVSSYQRTMETLSGILHGLTGHFPGAPKLYEDPRLVEKFFGAASAMQFAAQDLDPGVIHAIRTLSAKVYKNDSFTAKHLFGDSTLDTFTRVKNFIDGTLSRDIAQGKEDFLIVAHGAVIQAFIMNWAHLPMAAKNELGNPGNGDVIAIEGTPRNWTIKKIYDGELGIKMDRDMIGSITRLSVSTLPPIPPHLI